MYRKAKNIFAKLLSLLCVMGMAQVSFCEPGVDGWGRLAGQFGKIAAKTGENVTILFEELTRTATRTAAEVTRQVYKQSPVINVNLEGHSTYVVLPKLTGATSKTTGLTWLSRQEMWAQIHGQHKEIPEYEDVEALRRDLAKYVQARYNYPNRLAYLVGNDVFYKAPNGPGIYKVWEFPTGIAHIRTELDPWEINLREYVFVQREDGTSPITLIKSQVEGFLTNAYRKPVPEVLENLQRFPEKPADLWDLFAKRLYYSYDELQGDMFLFFSHAPYEMKQSLLLGRATLKDEVQGWRTYRIYKLPVEEIQVDLFSAPPATYNAGDYAVFIRDEVQEDMQDLDELWSSQAIIINKPENVTRYTVGEIEWL